MINLRKTHFLANINDCTFLKAYEFLLVTFVAERSDMENNHT